MDLPAEVAKVFAEFRSAEFATVARDGSPWRCRWLRYGSRPRTAS
jgi:hypothetical protein